jgi:predicted Rossmann fold flavoprotein
MFDVIIIGAGAAGLLCAIEAGRRNRSVLLLDHADKAGKKILISGGGRCNFTNLNTHPDNFISNNPHFAKSPLSRYTPADFIAFVEQHHIPYHEKTLGQLFCDRSAHDIVTMLEREAAAAHVVSLLGTSVTSIQPTTSNQQPTTRFIVHTSTASFHAHSLVVATGGLSIPKMGATDLGYRIAQQFGLNIIPTRPALVPLVFNSTDHATWCDLAGLSAEVIATALAPSHARIRPPAFREKFLITHRGLSGPAILQISSYWQPGEPIHLDLAPNLNIVQSLLTPNAQRNANAIFQSLRTTLPTRLAERWLTLNPPPAWTNIALADFERKLHDFTLTPAGTEGYPKAEVTAGGVDTAELDSSTMQSKKIPGLYFIGEVVDVTGWLGGYNFQWAWASAAAAGRSL